MTHSCVHNINKQQSKVSRILKEFRTEYIKTYGQIPSKRDFIIFTHGLNVGFKFDEITECPEIVDRRTQHETK